MAQDKKVIREYSGWIRVFDDGSVDRTFTGPPEFKFLVDAVPPHHHFVDGVATADITADGLKLRIYLPERQENDLAKLPIILHFHGGGFVISETDFFMYYAFYKRLAREARAIVVSPYLRRGPEHRLPAPCDDGFSALMWLRSVARGQSHHPWLHGDHADFNRVFLIGDSAGGNIVHQVAARGGEEDLSPLSVVGAIPICPGFLRSQRSKSEMENPQSPFFNLDMVDNLLKLGLPEGATKDHPITCPMGEAAPPLEGLKLPPYLLCVAELDLIRDTQLEFYEALKRANKEAELFMINGFGHCFYLFTNPAGDTDPKFDGEKNKLFQKIIEFINKH